MICRIIQISDKPISPNDFINSDSLEEIKEIVPEVDYLTYYGLRDRMTELHSFFDATPKDVFRLDNDSIVLADRKIIYKAIAERIENFKRLANDLTVEDFISNNETLKQVSKLITSTEYNGTSVYYTPKDSYFGTIKSIEDWLVYVYNNYTVGSKFYLGGITKCHL